MVLAAVVAAAAILAHLVLPDHLFILLMDLIEVEQFQIYYLYNLNHS